MTVPKGLLTGRVVVVTGASRGIGRVLARSFGAAGASLGLLARNATAIKELAAELPGPCVPVSCDVSDADAVAEAFAAIAGELGAVDSVVANAGIAPESHRAHQLSVATWRQVLEVNLTGTFLTAQAAHPYLAASRRGRLVLTSSVMARLPRRGLSAYAASKAGIEGLARALAADWAGDRICVNAVAPGFVDSGLGNAFLANERLHAQVTGRTAAGRFGYTDELAATTGFLASDAAGYLTGQTVAVDGGYGLG
ncbi:MAG TPA: SDR family NAD(P)-dependent oxidoreductase [Pseudonocardiaceae bacterium]|jgi:NAD(P)-dependent dehydrogenase (short-subunit alcohol dehydrogenase family)|nr:SDR family NAD(P)-dependent oxidoreductase [Pseudonocardiaceae bacterium]